MSAKAAARTMDRAAAVRGALRRLVARYGFHGASMNAVAREAGVATGTAYVHYESKEALVFAAYFELKRDLGAASTLELDPKATPRDRFEGVWAATYRFLSQAPEQARFLLQMEVSPYAERAHELFAAQADDPLVAMSREADLASCLVDLPPLVIYDLGIGPAVRQAASGTRLSDETLALMAGQSWRAVTR